MRRAGQRLFALTSLLGLAGLAAVGPEVGYGDQPRQLVAAKDDAPCDDDFCLKRSRHGANWHLVYGFKGPNDRWHELACDVSEDDSRRQRASFGYRDAERAAAWPTYLERAVNTAARHSPLAFEYGEAHVTRRGVEWQPAGPLPPLVGDELMRTERERFGRWYSEHREELTRSANEKFLQDHGFMVVPGLGEIPDYPAIVHASAATLKECVDTLDQETGGRPEILQAFFQAMVWKEIPIRDRGKRTGGFSLPPTVMIEGFGDCDSKAAAFCTIQRKRDPSLLLFVSLPGAHSPRHALVGVEAWKKDGRHPKEKWRYKKLPEALKAILYGDPVRIGLRDYWPCEVAGRARTAFGQVGAGHEGLYLAIPID